MALVENLLIALLRADAAVTALAGQRSYYFNIPQNVTLPAVVVTKIGGDSELMHDGAGGFERDRFQISAIATKATDAKNLSKAIRELFHGYRGSGSGFTIDYCELVNEIDLYDPDYGYQVALEFLTGYKET